MNEPPESWVRAPLGELVKNMDNERVPVNAKERSTRQGTVPYYGAAGQVGWIDRALFDEALLLLGEDGVQFFDPAKPKAYLVDGPSWVNNHAHVLSRIDGGPPLPYLKYFLDKFDYRGYANGTTRLKLTRSAMDTIPVALAPLAEQERIVTAIEEAFSKLDAGEAGLRTIRQRLKRMRDAVLAAAVTGRLVPQDPTDIPASKLLADLGVESLDSSSLPAGWVASKLESVLEKTIGGVWGAEPGADEIDVKVLRVTEMRPDGTLDPATAALRSIKRSQLDSRELIVGDLLLEKSGGGPRRPVGRVGMVRAVNGPSVCANFMQLLRPDRRLCTSDYLELALRQFHASRGTESLQTATTNIRNLKMKDYFAVATALPPLVEQDRIVTEVARQFSFIEACERAIDAGLTRSTALRRSVLKAAFEGRLVPQAPSDEPASVLLDRIRVERASTERTSGGRRRKKRKAS